MGEEVEIRAHKNIKNIFILNLHFCLQARTGPESLLQETAHAEPHGGSPAAHLEEETKGRANESRPTRWRALATLRRIGGARGLSMCPRHFILDSSFALARVSRWHSGCDLHAAI